MPRQPGSLGQRRGSPVIVIEPPRGAVVAAVGGQDLVAAGVEAGHADGVLVRLGAAVGEEHHVEVAGRELGDEAGRLAAVGRWRRNGAMVHSRSACSWMAATSRGCWWPMFRLTSCEEKSR